MIDLKKLQKEVFQNKVAKGFNITDVYQEFCFIFGELAEALQAYRKKLPDLGEELADIVIYVLGLAEILGIDLEQEILRKVEKNYRREYQKVDGENVRVKEG